MWGFFSRYTEVSVYPPSAGRMKYKKPLILLTECPQDLTEYIRTESPAKCVFIQQKIMKSFVLIDKWADPKA